MRQQLEAAERDPAWAFTPSHTGWRVTAGCHPTQGSSRAMITHSNWLWAGANLPGTGLGIHRTSGALASAPNEINVLQCFWLISSQPCVAVARATLSPRQTTPGTSLAPPKATASAPQQHVPQQHCSQAEQSCLWPHASLRQCPAMKSIP